MHPQQTQTLSVVSVTFGCIIKGKAQRSLCPAGWSIKPQTGQGMRERKWRLFPKVSGLAVAIRKRTKAKLQPAHLPICRTQTCSNCPVQIIASALSSWVKGRRNPLLLNTPGLVLALIFTIGISFYKYKELPCFLSQISEKYGLPEESIYKVYKKCKRG